MNINLAAIRRVNHIQTPDLPLISGLQAKIKLILLQLALSVLSLHDYIDHVLDRLLHHNVLLHRDLHKAIKTCQINKIYCLTKKKHYKEI